MEVKVLGIDLSKNLFHLHGVDPGGRAVLRRRLRREQILPFVAALPPCTIGIEACASAFHWAREFERAGHAVRIVSPQFVKPFVRGNKNDGNDAEAICEAVQRPSMRFVPLKTVAQQDIQSLHRCRQRLVNHRTALISQMRGVLLDRGIAFGKSASRARAAIPRIIADAGNGLTAMIREVLASLFEFLGSWTRGSVTSTGASRPCSAKSPPASASPRSRASARRPRPPSWPPWATRKTSRTAGTWRLGSDSCLGTRRPAGER